MPVDRGEPGTSTPRRTRLDPRRAGQEGGSGIYKPFIWMLSIWASFKFKPIYHALYRYPAGRDSVSSHIISLTQFILFFLCILRKNERV